jgi:hypothetical protein
VKKNTKEVILVGGGRWAQIYLNNLLKRNLKLTLVSKNNDLKKILLKNKSKKIKFQNDLAKTKIKKNDFIIIANKTEARLNIFKKYKNKSNQILFEKPLFLNPNNFKKYKLKKDNFYLALQFNFAKYFKIIRKKIENEKIYSIKLNWFDNYNEKKKFNKLNFIEDAYYHFYSIIKLFVKNKPLINKISIIKKNKIYTEVDNLKLILNAEKKNVSKKRTLEIKTNKNNFVINFKNHKIIYIYKNKRKILELKKKTENLPIQIDSFLNNNKTINNNSFNNLNYLFEDLVNIRNEIKNI